MLNCKNPREDPLKCDIRVTREKLKNKLQREPNAKEVLKHLPHHAKDETVIDVDDICDFHERFPEWN